MSGIIICRRLLTDNAAMVAAVPVARIISGIIPQATALPCISLTDISSTDRHALAAGSSIKVTDRVQITVLAATYPEVKSTIALVRKACRNKSGTVGAYTFITCRLDGKGPDFTDPDAGFFMQTQDTLITFNEAA